MGKNKKEIVISKEDAVFWLDKNGCWHNAAGKFRHKKIIDFFNASIRKDAGGFHLCQLRDDCVEKVYFPYEDTALFVFDVIDNAEITLVLNTTERIGLKPESLYVRDDSLYVLHGGDPVKFSERAMLKIAPRLDFKDGGYFFKSGDRALAVPTRRN